LLIVGELFSIALFAALVFAAGRVILPSGAWLLTAGVLLPSILQLLIRRFVAPGGSLDVLLTFAIAPTLLQAAVALTAVTLTDRRKTWDEPELSALMKLTGLTGFAALPPLGLVLVKSGDWLATLQQLAYVITWLAYGPLLVGLTIWKRVTAPTLVSR